MSPDALFSIANLLPLPVWALWILRARARPTSAVSRA